MIQGINDNRIDVGSAGRSQELLRIATQSDLDYCASSITREGDGIVKTVTGSISSLFSKVWGGFKWLLSKVFFCYDCSSILGKSRLEVLKDLKEAAEQGKAKLKELVEKHGTGSSNREALSNDWKSAFDQFPQGLQERLMATYFRGLATGKGLADEPEVQEYVQGCFKVDQDREHALGFVHLLKFDSGTDPCQEMLDVSFDFITGNLTKEIAKLETK